MDTPKDRCEICGGEQAVLSNTIYVDVWDTPHNIKLCYTCHSICNDSGGNYYGIYIPKYIPKEQCVMYLRKKVIKKKKERLLSQNEIKSKE